MWDRVDHRTVKAITKKMILDTSSGRKKHMGFLKMVNRTLLVVEGKHVKSLGISGGGGGAGRRGFFKYPTNFCWKKKFNQFVSLG